VPSLPPVDLELPVDALQRTKAVGLWYEDDTLRVRAHLRDAYTEPDGSSLVLHEYRLRRLGGELGRTHLNSLISDLVIAGLFHGYLRVRAETRRRGTLPVMPASGDRTGICSGWRAGGTLATWMEQGRGIAPSDIYPTDAGAGPHQEP
jgi:hypothetical protein